MTNLRYPLGQLLLFQLFLATFLYIIVLLFYNCPSFFYRTGYLNYQDRHVRTSKQLYLKNIQLIQLYASAYFHHLAIKVLRLFPEYLDAHALLVPFVISLLFRNLGNF